MAYKWDSEREQQYLKLCEQGIGYNVPYAKGTFKIINGKREFVQEKAKRLENAILDKTTQFITVEGGKRGGKDVYALYCYAKYLMTCPNKLHLVTGNTINHAIATVLEADGFGLKYLIPHGIGKKEHNRFVFLFIDFYGEEKQIDFFAGAQYNDREAFRGYSYGSHYANEAINQHINTISEGRDRTNASKWRKIIHTQNPKGGSFEYYEAYEKPLRLSFDMKKSIEEQKEKMNKLLPIINNKYKLKYLKKKEKIEKVFVDTAKVNNIEEFKKKKYDSQLYSELFTKFVKTIRNLKNEIELEYIAESKAECRNFEYIYNNPNNVNNGLFFRYFHFNHYDNLSMTDYQRNIIESSFDKSGVMFKRDIMGIRASAEGAIWDTLTDKNIIRDDIPNYTGYDRYIVIDFGMKNDFVAIDCEVDSEYNCYIYKEIRFNGRKLEKDGNVSVDLLPTTEVYADMVEELIEQRNYGQYMAIYIDPSATPMRNELLKRGLSVRSAKNDVGQRRKKDTADKKVDKSITGIWLVRDGFSKKKIFIHESCKEGLDECYGYVFDPQKLMKGEEVPLKVRDHFPDCVRYLINSVVRTARRWE